MMLTLISGSYRGQRFQTFVYLPVDNEGRPYITQEQLSYLFKEAGINMYQHTTYTVGG